MADRTHGPLRLGERFLKYGIERLLGRGGHAWVYEGHDPFLERKVAVKVLHRPGGVTEDMLRRGRAEAKLLHRLKHPNIVDVFDAGMTESGVLYIVMELLAGTTLREVLRRRVRLPVREALRIFAAVADGVSAAHAAGAIHRDLKPENIVILDDGRAKVLDFGVAKLADSAGLTTEKDVIHGTMLYMSPEQLNGLRATARSDVYAVGLTLYESLAGRHPCLLKNQSPTIRELAVIQTSVRPPFVDELVSSIPRHVARLCDRAVTKVPAQRFASMSELRDALRESLDRCEKDGIGATEVFERSASVAPGLHHDTERMNVPAFTAERTAPPVATDRRRGIDGRRRKGPSGGRLRGVLAAGAVVGVVSGVVASFALDAAPALPERGEGREGANLEAAQTLVGVPPTRPPAPELSGTIAAPPRASAASPVLPTPAVGGVKASAPAIRPANRTPATTRVARTPTSVGSPAPGPTGLGAASSSAALGVREPWIQ